MISKNLPRKVVDDRIEIFGQYNYYTVAMLIAKVKEVEATIPAEFRDTVDFYVDVHYDDPHSDMKFPYLMMKFQRLETDKECEERLKKEQSRQAEIEKRERDEYERLAKKFANN